MAMISTEFFSYIVRVTSADVIFCPFVQIEKYYIILWKEREFTCALLT